MRVETANFQLRHNGVALVLKSAHYRGHNARKTVALVISDDAADRKAVANELRIMADCLEHGLHVGQTVDARA